MKMKKNLGQIILAIALGVLMAVAVTGCSSTPEKKPAANAPAAASADDSLAKITAKGRLVVGVNADFAPFEFHAMINGKDTVVGFDMDLAKEIAKDMGVELELKELSFNGFFSFKEDSKTISIGVERNGQFIDYAMLSKGEKLLFAVAIMTAFYKENKNSSFKVLVIDNVLDIGEKRLTELTEYITKNQEHYDIVLIGGIVEEKINKKFKVINFSEVKEQMSLLEGVV